MTGAEHSGLAERLASVNERVARAAAAAGRPGGVLLIAVSKAQPAEALRAAYSAGQRDFGENYVQELEQKSGELAELGDLRFHMIGHLQRNKVRHVVKHVSAVHSVDSLELVRELDRRAADRALPAGRRVFGADSRLPVLVEVNVAEEPQKSGVRASELGALLDSIESAPHLRLCGLMCVPPIADEPRASVPHFEALARLREAHGGVTRLPELSMGMTADFEVAIACGATVVRVGTAIFGARTPRGA